MRSLASVLVASSLVALAPVSQVVAMEPFSAQEERQAWTFVGEEPAPSAQWELVDQPGIVPPAFLPPPNDQSPEQRNAVAREFSPIEDPALFGLGGGVRFGAGDSTNGVVTARAGIKLNQQLSISARPTVIFGSSDQQGKANNQTEFRLPFTLDFARQAVISPYFGGGIATNADSTGATDPMLTGGFDLKLGQQLRLGFNYNYIFQNSINDNDSEFMTLLYLAF